MLNEIVVDVNVMLHAANPKEARQQESEDFLRRLMSCTTSLCLDDGFDPDPAHNNSQIGHEYLSNLNSGMLAYAVIAHLAGSGRVRTKPRKIPQAVSKHIRQKVPKVTDRIYVAIAYNSEDRMLTSHDFVDFPQRVRNEFSNAYSVRIYTAGRAHVEL